MKLPRPLGIALRIAVTLAAAALAFSHVSLATVLPLLRHIPLTILLSALLLIHAGQILSGLRTRFYLQWLGIALPIAPALQLHYVGGLFNAFLPGGAGGDVFKAWWLKRHRQGTLGGMVKLMIAGRLNGLWALGVILCLLGLAGEPLRALAPWAAAAMAGCLVAGTLGYIILARFVLRESLRQQFGAAPYSFGLQILLAAAAYLLCIGLGQQAHAAEYTVLFLLSCMLAMLPISIGGIGVRELAVLTGSRLLHLPEESGVTLAFAFTVLNLSIPLIGAVLYQGYLHRHEEPVA